MTYDWMTREISGGPSVIIKKVQDTTLFFPCMMEMGGVKFGGIPSLKRQGCSSERAGTSSVPPPAVVYEISQGRFLWRERGGTTGPLPPIPGWRQQATRARMGHTSSAAVDLENKKVRLFLFGAAEYCLFRKTGGSH